MNVMGRVLSSLHFVLYVDIPHRPRFHYNVHRQMVARHKTDREKSTIPCADKQQNVNISIFLLFECLSSSCF